MDHANGNITTTVEHKDITAATTAALNYLRTVKVEITDQETYDAAVAAGKEVKGKAKDLEERRKEITVPLDKAKQSVMDLFRPVAERLTDMEGQLKTACIEYEDKKEAERVVEEKRLADIVLKDAEKERKKLEKKAVTQESKGNTEAAEDLRYDAGQVEAAPAPILPPAVNRSKGTSRRLKYYGEVKNFAALPDPYKVKDQAAIDKVGQATKGKQAIPGVEWKTKPIMSMGSR